MHHNGGNGRAQVIGVEAENYCRDSCLGSGKHSIGQLQNPTEAMQDLPFFKVEYQHQSLFKPRHGIVNWFSVFNQHHP